MKKFSILAEHKYICLLFCFVFIVTFIESVTAQSKQELTKNVAADPMNARFVYTDIENFLDAQKAIKAGADPTEALRTKYLEKASPGLLMFIEKYNLTTSRLEKAMAENPEKYARLEDSLKALKAQKNEFKKVYGQNKRVIPNAVFPPTYLLVAGHRGIGSGSIEGPLISIEKESTESIKGDLVATLVHEMMHMQQLAATGKKYFAIFSGKERTLLANSIREGAATYFSELITGGSVHKNLARDYYLANEKELWNSFSQEMYGNKMGDWLWKNPANPEQPQDIGYAIGSRIVGFYYQNSKDKGKAAKEIISIIDYTGFLEKSGYPAKMKKLQQAKNIK